MQERTFNAEGLIIRSRDYGDNDKIITFLSREYGKLSAIVKGARKQKSSLRGAVRIFSNSRLFISRGRGSLFVVTQGEVLNSFLSLSMELDKIAYASYFAELLDVGVPEHKQMADIYLLALAAYSFIDMHTDLRMPRCLFELRFLKFMGLSPELSRCMMCKREARHDAFHLSPLRGGLVCEPCGGGEAALSAGTIQIMRKLLDAELPHLLRLRISEENYRQITDALVAYLDYHLEYSSRARKFLERL